MTDLCRTCGHPNGDHRLCGYGAPPTEGWIECPVEGCACPATWSLEPEVAAQIRALQKETTPTLDVVHTVRDWYDGPRSGSAQYQDAPYWYRSVYLDADEWNEEEDRFELTPLSEEALAWDRERSEIFRRWDALRTEADRRHSPVDPETFGALPEDRVRYAELNGRLEDFLRHHPPTVLARGTFEPRTEHVTWEFLSSLPVA
jgi:hypothetical protein